MVIGRPGRALPGRPMGDGHRAIRTIVQEWGAVRKTPFTDWTAGPPGGPRGPARPAVGTVARRPSPRWGRSPRPPAARCRAPGGRRPGVGTGAGRPLPGRAGLRGALRGRAAGRDARVRGGLGGGVPLGRGRLRGLAVAVQQRPLARRPGRRRDHVEPGGQRHHGDRDQRAEGQQRHQLGQGRHAGQCGVRPARGRGGGLGQRGPGPPEVPGGHRRDQREQCEVDQALRPEDTTVGERLGPVAAERRSQECVVQQTAAPAGEQVVHHEEDGQLEQHRQAAGQRRGAGVGVQLAHRLLQPLGVALVRALQFRHARGERRAGLLAAGGRAGEGVQRGTDAQRAQDDGGGHGRRAEERGECVGGVGQCLAEEAEHGHG